MSVPALTSSFYQTFSGTDTLIFLIIPGCTPVCLGSISTISYSVYRTKQPVINLGRTNINGVTRGARVFAGSIIFTMINQHWVKELQSMNNTQWLSNFQELKSDELPPFDIMVTSANEYGSYVAMFLFGVEITDEGQVVSVNDMFTENTCSFVARDIESFTAGFQNEASAKSSGLWQNEWKDAKVSGVSPAEYNIDTGNDETSVSYNSTGISPSNGNTYSDYDEVIPNKLTDSDGVEVINTSSVPVSKQKSDALKKASGLIGYTRPLENNTYRPMVGSDVNKVQLVLKELELAEYVSNIYDEATMNAVKKFQSMNGIYPSGIVDAATWIALMDKTNDDSVILGTVINISGARVYQTPDADSSNIVYIHPYEDIIEIYDIIEKNGKKYYVTDKGYIEDHDVYSPHYTGTSHEYPTIKLYDSGHYVLCLQQLMINEWEFTYKPGIYDETMRDIIIRIQRENGIVCEEGVVNEDTWRVIQALCGKNITDVSANKVSVISRNAQGEYHIEKGALNTPFMQGFDLSITSELSAIINMTCLSYFENGGIETVEQSYTTRGLMVKNIPFSDFLHAFNYSIDHNGEPYKVEYIVYASNGLAFKWTIFYG